MGRVCCILALLLACSVAAAQSTPPAGSYESSNGELTVKASGGATTFEITTVGGNGHTCGLEGEIRSGTAQLDGSGGSCVVTFRATEHGVEVSGNPECRYWCGARATFEGTFLPADAPCASKARGAVRQTFQRAYDHKDYAAARAILEPLLADCAPAMSWFDNLALRNDLAITLFHLHERRACLAALEPLAEDAAGTDDDLLNRGVVEAEVMRPLVHAARTNLKRCRSLPEAP